MKKFTEWGLANVHHETWAFGKGWSLVRFSAHLIEPQVQPLIGFPGSWTPGTKGAVTADVVRVQIDERGGLREVSRQARGQDRADAAGARGARCSKGRSSSGWTTRTSRKRDDADSRRRGAGGRGGARRPRRRGGGADAAARSFAAEARSSSTRPKGVVALFDRGSDSDMAAGGSDLSWQQQRPDGGTIFPTGGGSRGADAGTGVPTVTLAVEHYNRMVRVLDKGVPVKVELNVETKFYDETTPNGFNIDRRDSRHRSGAQG